MNPRRTLWSLALTFGVGLLLAACDDGGGDDSSLMCDIYEFEYEGMPDENNQCPQLECCPDDVTGNFSVYNKGMCLSSANCEAVCADTDEAFACLIQDA